jgi:dTDP-4-dehydrorhamnose reductase
MKVLVLGSNGQLGLCLQDKFTADNLDVVFSSKKEIDVSEFIETKNKIQNISPDIIINASAYTKVDEAEDNYEDSRLINNLAVKNIAEIAKILDCWLIHISTDYVFDGEKQIAYLENDVPNPLSVYGKTKLDGENAIVDSNCKYIIIRTSWIFSEYGKNFFKTILNLAISRQELSIIQDQIGTPTYAQDLARAILAILPFLSNSRESGIYNFSGDEPDSWYGFAEHILIEAKNSGLIERVPVLKGIKSSEYSSRAHRPKNSVLDSSKIKNDFRVEASNWRKGIISAMESLNV